MVVNNNSPGGVSVFSLLFYLAIMFRTLPVNSKVGVWPPFVSMVLLKFPQTQIFRFPPEKFTSLCGEKREEDVPRNMTIFEETR